VTVRRPPRAKAKAPAPPASPTFGTPLPLGKTGRTHPAIGLGLWAMGRWTREDEAKTKTVIEHAVSIGVPWLDTAEVYGTGRSERLLGDVLARQPPASGVFLTTKVSWEHLRSAQIRAALTGSLQRLGRRSVDVYLVHAPDPHVPIRETMETLEQLWKEGRIGGIGVSNFSVAELEAASEALHEAPLVVHQVKYSLLDRTDGDDVLPYCQAHGIVVEAYTPLARGLLAGRYLNGRPPPADVRRFARDLFDHDRFPQVLARARDLRLLADEAGVPMASLALHWLGARGIAPLFGASRPEQVDELLAAWAVRPPPAVLARADALTRGALD
jgi:myo-inositol catabolism protein IolS